MNIADTVRKMPNYINKKSAIAVLIIIVALALLSFWVWQNTKPGQLDDFAKCLKDKGAKFYGAFWCPHCQSQKKMFSSSQKYLPYIECSTPDGKGQLQACKDANINGYPTWEFSDGSREQGEVSLQKLSEKSGCQLPNQ